MRVQVVPCILSKTHHFPLPQSAHLLKMRCNCILKSQPCHILYHSKSWKLPVGYTCLRSTRPLCTLISQTGCSADRISWNVRCRGRRSASSISNSCQAKPNKPMIKMFHVWLANRFLVNKFTSRTVSFFINVVACNSMKAWLLFLLDCVSSARLFWVNHTTLWFSNSCELPGCQVII